MRLACCLAAAAALAIAGDARTDDAAIMASYDAYERGLAAGDFDAADAAGEAAWRGAEAEWGEVEDTGVLAFNLARLRLMRDQRAAALEPAERVRDLVGAGAVASVSAQEAALLVAAAQLSDDPSREQLRTLEAALDGFAPSGMEMNRVAWLADSRVASARSERRQWTEAYAAADRALALMENDPTATTDLRGAIATLGARAAANERRLGDAIAMTHKGLAAFPPQPLDQPMNATLALLIGWEAGLSNLYASEEGEAYESAVAIESWRWAEERYPMRMGCRVEWIDRQAPSYPQSAQSLGQELGLLLEFHLDTNGSVIRVDPVGRAGGMDAFVRAAVAAARTWRAAPQEREECRGPWPVMFYFQFAD